MNSTVLARRLCTGFLVILVTVTAWPVPVFGTPSLVNAKAAVLMDAQTGRVLYARNMHRRLPQASTTKITTAILAIEKGDLDKKVRISRHAASTGEATMGLRSGEVLSVRDLLYGMLLQSGNDAAVAIAEAVGGSEKRFVRLMNQFVAKVGAKNTHYVNPHGLHDPEHYSSAYDLALITRYALQFPEFRKIVSTRMQPVVRQGWSRPQLIKNKNRLLTGDDEYYPYADGVKPGYTSPAGNCLVSSATRDGWTLIAVVLNSWDVYGESKKLLEWGFSSFKRKVLVEKNIVVDLVKVEKGREDTVIVVTAEDLFVPLLGREKGKIEKRVVLPDKVTAPVRKGERLGEMQVFYDGKKIAAVDLVAAEAVKERSYLAAIWQALISLFVF